MSKLYEIVIWTAGMKEYADWVINILDKYKCIKYRLYRQHTQEKNDTYIKDLSKLGRNIAKTIIIDNL